ncbi:hypothetical protein E2C01_001081 [Portunus trituberculatus]|uniref:Uncharacterized protein n=1 Tax=Portunus trituberculatus TaxID=210409 RepID=A0A5B7CLL3_PORTR|nr:hypothetical protein [Portunus trituberculatus]
MLLKEGCVRYGRGQLNVACPQCLQQPNMCLLCLPHHLLHVSLCPHLPRPLSPTSSCQGGKVVLLEKTVCTYQIEMYRCIGIGIGIGGIGPFFGYRYRRSAEATVHVPDPPKSQAIKMTLFMTTPTIERIHHLHHRTLPSPYLSRHHLGLLGHRNLQESD